MSKEKDDVLEVEEIEEEKKPLVIQPSEPEVEEVQVEEIQFESDSPTGLAIQEITNKIALGTQSLYDELFLAFHKRVLPSYIKSPEQAFVVAKFAQELDIQPMIGFKLIYPVKNVPALTAMGLGFLIRRSGGSYYVHKDFVKEAYKDEDGKPKRDKDGRIMIKRLYTEIWACRPNELMKDENGNAIIHKITFTWAEAEAQGLTGKYTWQTMPENMLRARCLSKVARIVFPDFIHGFYLADELDDTGKLGYDDEGNLLKI